MNEAFIFGLLLGLTPLFVLAWFLGNEAKKMAKALEEQKDAYFKQAAQTRARISELEQVFKQK